MKGVGGESGLKMLSVCTGILFFYLSLCGVTHANDKK